MKIHFETDQFIVRDLEETDAAGIFALDSDMDVHEYLGKNPISTLQEAENIIEKVRGQYIKNGIGRWAIIDKVTGDFVGWTGLKYEKEVRDFNYYDLGYRLRKQYWGKGIATKTALKSIKYGFEELELPEIFAAADVNNIASNRVLSKVGLQFIETFEFEGNQINWYKLSKHDWQASIHSS